jgi:hypothetical protein
LRAVDYLRRTLLVRWRALGLTGLSLVATSIAHRCIAAVSAALRADSAPAVSAVSRFAFYFWWLARVGEYACACVRRAAARRVGEDVAPRPPLWVHRPESNPHLYQPLVHLQFITGIPLRLDLHATYLVQGIPGAAVAGQAAFWAKTPRTMEMSTLGRLNPMRVQALVGGMS